MNSSTATAVIDLHLSQPGHDGDRVENGRAAVEAVQPQRYDVVLMDARMPVMDGVEATTARPDLEPTLAELQDERVRVSDAVRTLFDDRRP